MCVCGYYPVLRILHVVCSLILITTLRGRGDSLHWQMKKLRKKEMKSLAWQKAGQLCFSSWSVVWVCGRGKQRASEYHLLEAGSLPYTGCPQRGRGGACVEGDSRVWAEQLHSLLWAQVTPGQVGAVSWTCPSASCLCSDILALAAQEGGGNPPRAMQD